MLERLLLLEIIDQRWQEHLYDMDYLREGIHLRGFAQIEPLVAYKNEAFDLFRDLMNSVWADFARLIFHVEVTLQDPNGGLPGRPPRRRAEPGQQLSHRRRPGQLLGRQRGRGPARWRWRGGRAAPGSRAATATPRHRRRPPPVVEQRRVDESRADRAQRPVLVRLGQEVQEVPRRVTEAPAPL